MLSSVWSKLGPIVLIHFLIGLSSVPSAGQSGGLGAALQSYISSGEKAAVPSSEFPALTKRNSSSSRIREIGQLNSPFALSRSLGPPQGALAMSPYRPPVALSRGSDPPDNLTTSPHGNKQSGIKVGSRSVKSNTGILVASSPPRAHNFSQKVRVGDLGLSHPGLQFLVGTLKLSVSLTALLLDRHVRHQ